MNKSNLFKLAHTLTKATIKAGDNYQVTFGAAVKHINSIHNITGTDKQLAWANTIITNIITTIKAANDNIGAHFANNRTDVRALPALNATLNKGIAHFINKYASMSFNELIALAANKTYKDMRQELDAKIVKAVLQNVKKMEAKKGVKFIK
ncbi:hypothetical protein [Psychrobacter namhaensis]|uniref:hypothetical protein n=1 Tax=Psychrobacter namhaensis TaxID=292734 RepID=UPI0018DFBA7E|nr:hypothetical protein [Psychrobacter namhaensis]